MEVFTIRMTSAFIVMMVPFINVHTKLTIQVFIYFIYVAGHNKIQIPRGVLAMFAYGGVRAMFLGLKFQLKAIFWV